MKTMVVRVAGFSLILALAGFARAGDDRPVRNVDDPALREGIHGAIAGAVKHLKASQAEDGSWSIQFRVSGGDGRFQANGGVTACAIYALAASGVPQDDLSIVRALEWITKNPSAFDPSNGSATYATSILVLGLTRIDPKAHKEAIHKHAKTIVDAMQSDGMWSYTLGPTRLKTGARSGTDRATWRKSATGGYSIPDNSNTQFAVLAMWAAHSMAGFEIPEKKWEKIRKHFLKNQLPDGSWSYRKIHKSPSATMTAAGLVSLVYAAAALDGSPAALEKARKHGAIRLGLKSLARHQARFRSRIPTNFYWLYSLERVGTVVGLKDNAWYVEGARQLVDHQDKSGAWPKWTPRAVKVPNFGVMPPPKGSVKWSRVYETSLALLLLSRATRPPRKGVTTPDDLVNVPKTPRSKGDRFPDLIDPSPGRDGRIERALTLYSLYSRDRRDAVAPLFGAIEAATLFPKLITRLEDDNEDTRDGAIDLLNRLTEEDFTWEATWPKHRRNSMFGPIRRFWEKRGASLEWDGGDRMFKARNR